MWQVVTVLDRSAHGQNKTGKMSTLELIELSLLVSSGDSTMSLLLLCHSRAAQEAARAETSGYFLP